LSDDSYVGRGSADDRFHLRMKVRGLSEGFEDEQWIAAVAVPALFELNRRTLEGLKMVIHETTHLIAPLSIDRNMVGQKLPILGSASGLADLSFAPKKERDTLLVLLARSSDPHDAPARDRTQVSRLIGATRRYGYGLWQGGEIWPHTGSLALPVPVGSRILGCINTVWMARVISATEGVSLALSRRAGQGSSSSSNLQKQGRINHRCCLRSGQTLRSSPVRWAR
jgi:IclR family mhp operon transcriptional activator